MAADSADYTATINELVATTLNRTSLLIGKKYTGKVRDVYETRDHLVLVTTDRQSAFDRLLACVPFKGQVLNMTSAWWFRQTQEIVPNHVISMPHPNVTIARKCTPFRVEFVVRAYLTGSTSTSIWVHYQAGARNYCGHALPDGERAGTVLVVRWLGWCGVGELLDDAVGWVGSDFRARADRSIDRARRDVT
jgi:phosphoribosylaminoimidazole-succinocarboxamide synthase